MRLIHEGMHNTTGLARVVHVIFSSLIATGHNRSYGGRQSFKSECKKTSEHFGHTLEHEPNDHY